MNSCLILTKYGNQQRNKQLIYISSIIDSTQQKAIQYYCQIDLKDSLVAAAHITSYSFLYRRTRYSRIKQTQTPLTTSLSWTGSDQCYENSYHGTTRCTGKIKKYKLIFTCFITFIYQTLKKKEGG